ARAAEGRIALPPDRAQPVRRPLPERDRPVALSSAGGVGRGRRLGGDCRVGPPVQPGLRRADADRRAARAATGGAVAVVRGMDVARGLASDVAPAQRSLRQPVGDCRVTDARVTGIWLPRVGNDGVGQAVSVVAAADEALAAWLHAGHRVQPLATADEGACRVVWAFDDRLAIALVRGATRLGQRVQRVTPVMAADILAPGDGGPFARLAFTRPTHFRAGRDHLAPNSSER